MSLDQTSESVPCLPDGLLFDFDGIIVDTEPIHYQAFQHVLEPDGLGYAWQDYVDVYIGFDDRDAFREGYRRAGRQLPDDHLSALIEKKALAFCKLLEMQEIRPYPGVLELIRAAAGKIPLGLCSGGLKSDIQPILEKLGLTEGWWVMVTAEDVSRSKPDPESYEQAFTRLAHAAEPRMLERGRVVAIEDTPAGIQAAQGAGLPVIGVSNTHPRSRLSSAERVVDSLEGVTLQTLGGWLAAF